MFFSVVRKPTLLPFDPTSKTGDARMQFDETEYDTVKQFLGEFRFEFESSIDGSTDGTEMFFHVRGFNGPGMFYFFINF